MSFAGRIREVKEVARDIAEYEAVQNLREDGVDSQRDPANSRV